MAIQSTQAKLEIAKCNCGDQACDKYHLNTQYVHGFNKADAQSICDAVNNTAGNGIDPNAVPGMLKTLVDMAEMKSTPDHIKKYARQAIKSAELK